MMSSFHLSIVDYDDLGVPTETSTIGLCAYHMARQDPYHILSAAKFDEIKAEYNRQRNTPVLFDLSVLTNQEKILVRNVHNEYFHGVTNADRK